MEREHLMHDEERSHEHMVNFDVSVVAPNGLGFGEGVISYQSRKNEVGEVIMQRAEAVAQSPDILLEVSKDKSGVILDDDGCGDGRNVNRVFEGYEERQKSLNRAKVFGGGAAMTAAALIGLGRASRSLRDTFSESMALLRDKQIGFGAHTDTHAHGDNCGCGAIDKAPRIIQNAVNFREQISASIAALGVEQAGLDEVLASFDSFATAMEHESYTGASVMGEIIDNGKIVKELDDNHKEGLVVLNTVEGYTVNQEKVREATDGEVQAFAVDVWRLQDIAKRAFADEPAEVQHKAFLSELVYTLATAGTLTNGDLPVVVVSKQPELVSA